MGHVRGVSVKKKQSFIYTLRGYAIPSSALAGPAAAQPIAVSLTVSLSRNFSTGGDPDRLTEMLLPDLLPSHRDRFLDADIL